MPGKDTLRMLYDTSAITSMLDFKASAEFTRALDTEHRAEQLVHFFAAASQAAAKESRGSVWGAPNAFTGMLNSSDLRNRRMSLSLTPASSPSAFRNAARGAQKLRFQRAVKAGKL